MRTEDPEEGAARAERRRARLARELLDKGVEPIAQVALRVDDDDFGVTLSSAASGIGS